MILFRVSDITNKYSIIFLEPLALKIFRICEMNIMLMARGNGISELPQIPWGSISNTVFLYGTRNFPQSTLLMIVISESFYQMFIIINLFNYLYQRGMNQYFLSKYASEALIMNLNFFFSNSVPGERDGNDNKNDNQITRVYLITSYKFSCASL